MSRHTAIKHTSADIYAGFNGSMFMPDGAIVPTLDARDGTDTYQERALMHVEQMATCGSATILLADQNVAS